MTDYFCIKLPEDDISNISILGLAHLGDAVYELMVRTWLCKNGKATSKGLHTAAVSYVSAPAQAAAVKRLMPFLDEKETEIYRRGRNTHVHSVPRNSTLEEYHSATGMEALFGYLYLHGENDRLNQLFAVIMDENTLAEGK